MDIKVSQDVINTACNSLRFSKQSLIRQMVQTTDENKKAIITQQLVEVKEALSAFQSLEA